MTSTRKRERQPPGNRVARAELRDLAPPERDSGDLEIEAELVRGVSYSLARSPRTLLFEFERKVPITRKEFDYLTATALDRVTYTDDRPEGTGVTIVWVQKFRFFDIKSGEVITPPAAQQPENALPALSAYDRFQRALIEKARTRAAGRAA